MPGRVEKIYGEMLVIFAGPYTELDEANKTELLLNLLDLETIDPATSSEVKLVRN